jgi:tellurite resistance protein TerC
MMASIQITHWHWTGFILCILIFLALDLGLFHRRPHTIKFKEALAWTLLWFTLAMLFAGAMAHWRGREAAVQFTAGYIIEFSLSLDNVLVIALIFSWFHVPREFQHRLLFWGIIGALVMRGLMIAVGVALIHQFAWVLYLFGALLVFTGARMLLTGAKTMEPERNPALQLARKLFPVSPDFAGGRFFTRVEGRLALTPMTLVLLLVETTDLIFAVDSVPAVFSVTRDAFIVFTSNVFAILGLRSLYFLLAGALNYFRYLKTGLSGVLLFIGTKMLLEPHGPSPLWFQVKIPTGLSLLVVAAILSAAIVLSVVAARREQKTKPRISTDGRG